MESGIRGALAASALCRGVPPAAVDAVAKRARAVLLNPGQILSPGAYRGDWLWFVLDGVLAKAVSSQAGPTAVVELLGPGSLFGSIVCRGCCADSDGSTTIQALTPSRLARLPAADVRSCLRRHPTAFERLLESQAGRVARVGRLSALAAEPAGRRVKAIVCLFHAVLGADIPLTRRALAAVARVTPETVMRSLAPYVRKGWLASRRGGLHLLDPVRFCAEARRLP